MGGGYSISRATTIEVPVPAIYPVVRVYDSGFSFTDQTGDPLAASCEAVITDLGNHVGLIAVSVALTGMSAWSGPGAWGFQSVLFPSDPIFDLCSGATAGGGVATGPGLGNIPFQFDLSAGAIFCRALEEFVPALPASTWVAQSFFRYS